MSHRGRINPALVLAGAALFALGLCIAVLASQATGAGFGQLQKWGGPGTGQGQFHKPALFGVDPATGNVFAADLVGGETEYRIQELSPTGTFIGSVQFSRNASIGGGKTVRARELGIAVNPDLHRFYVVEGCPTEASSECVQGGQRNRAVKVRVFKTEPNGSEELEELSSLTLPTDAGAIYRQRSLAIDPANGELEILGENAAGKYVIRRFSSSGAAGAGFTDAAGTLPVSNGPKGIVIAPSGKTYLMTGGASTGAEHTRAWELPSGLGSVAEVPGFKTGAEKEEWGNRLSAGEGATANEFGPQIALSTDGKVLYWKEDAGELGGVPNVLVRGFTLATHTTTVLYGGAPYEAGNGPCRLTTKTAGLATTDSGNLVVFDYGDTAADPPTFGDRVLTFGPGGSGCPVISADFTVAGSSADPAVVSRGELVSFDSSPSELQEATPDELVWDFGDGSKATLTPTPVESEGEVIETIPVARTVGHAYCTIPSGPLDVSLEMEVENSPFGQPLPAAKTVEVVPGKPRAAFTPSSSEPASGTAVSFDASKSVDPFGGPCTADAGASPVATLKSYEWDFGDGGSETTTANTVQHTFNGGGSHTVSLRVVSKEGVQSAPLSRTINVTDGSTGPSGGGLPPVITPPGPAPTPITPAKPPLTAKQKALAKCKKKKGKARAKCVKAANKKGKKGAGKSAAER